MNRLSRQFLVLLLASTVARTAVSADLDVEYLPELPVPMSNNAVALVPGQQGIRLFSFFGLEGGKTWRHLSATGWSLGPGAESWRPLSALPEMEGRLAAAAVAVTGRGMWVFGGYTVSEAGDEVSRPEVFRIDPASGEADHITDMPVPVDDMVALVYRGRYIYLVSGWHDLGNVNLVQVLDTDTLAWDMATPYPGEPVFGHAGGLAHKPLPGEDSVQPVLHGSMLICDGVRIEYPADASARQFLPSDECWRGDIHDGDFRRISWRPVPPHPSRSRYRAAAGPDAFGRIVFIGGSANPYNYDGVGYNGVPAEPETGIFRYDFADDEWESGWKWPEAGMDYRSLPYHDGWFYLAGGMKSGQAISRRVIRLRLREPQGAD